MKKRESLDGQNIIMKHALYQTRKLMMAYLGHINAPIVHLVTAFPVVYSAMLQANISQIISSHMFVMFVLKHFKEVMYLKDITEKCISRSIDFNVRSVKTDLNLPRS